MGTRDFIAPQSTGNKVKQAEISQGIEGLKKVLVINSSLNLGPICSPELLDWARAPQRGDKRASSESVTLLLERLWV